MALVAAYSFDTDYTDASGNANTITSTGNSAIVSGGQTSNALGKTGATMPVLPGAVLAACQSDDRTIMFDAKQNLTTWWVRFEKDAIGSGTWGILNISGSMTFFARRASDDAQMSSRPTATSPDSSGWHNYCVTYVRSTGVATFYRDGSSVGTASFAAGTQLVINADRINIAEWSGTGAAIDNLRLYSHALNSTEVAATAGTAVTSTLSVADTLSGIRVGKMVDAPSVGLTLADAAGALRVAVVAESPAIGIAATDIPAGVRAAALSDLPATGVAVADTPNGARAGALAASAAIGLVLADSLAAARIGTLLDAVAAGLILAEQLGCVRTVGLPERASAELVLPDVLSGTRVAGLQEIAFAGQTAADGLGSIRVGAMSEQTRGDLILLDVIGHGRVGVLDEHPATDLVLPDLLSVGRVGALAEVGQGPTTTLSDLLGVVRVGGLPVYPTGAVSQRDVTVTVRVLPSRYTARVLPPRWTAQEV